MSGRVVIEHVADLRLLEIAETIDAADHVIVVTLSAGAHEPVRLYLPCPHEKAVDATRRLLAILDTLEREER